MEEEQASVEVESMMKESQFISISSRREERRGEAAAAAARRKN